MSSLLPSRRAFLNTSGVSLGGIALAQLLQSRSCAADNPLAARQAHFAPRAKHVIYRQLL
ncbi:MAG: hypothetical protein ABGZ23_02455 [Fuerstiella sp.]